MVFDKKIKPKKRLGQNFLAQTGVIKKIVDAADVKPGQTILEIGPGTGNLTAQLAKTGNKVIAVEKDPLMAQVLKERFANVANVEIITADILFFDETKIAPPYKIVANLPFYAAAVIIRKFLEGTNPPLSMTVITQKEVGQRICAKPPKMNLLAVATQFYAAPRIIAMISRGCFWPQPKVDAAILQIIPLTRKGEHGDKKFSAEFFKIVKAGFSHPRKQLTNNLAKELNLDREIIQRWLEQNNIKPTQRPENLPVSDWIKLTQTQPMRYNNINR